MTMEPSGILHHLLKVVHAAPMINSDTLNAQSGSFDRLPTNAGKGSDSFASTGNRMMQNVVLTKQVIEFALPLENSKIESLLATAKSV